MVGRKMAERKMSENKNEGHDPFSYFPFLSFCPCVLAGIFLPTYFSVDLVFLQRTLGNKVDQTQGLFAVGTASSFSASFTFS